MALIELASSTFECQQVVICLDRSISQADSKSLLRSLKWVGFDLITLEMWAQERDITSEKWLFLGLEL